MSVPGRVRWRVLGLAVVLTAASIILAPQSCFRLRPKPAPPSPQRVAEIGGLSLHLPEGFEEKVREKTKVAIRNIPDSWTEQVFVSWQGPEDQALSLYFWSIGPPHDLGAMIAARSFDTTVAGRKARITETATFLGTEQKVLAVHLEAPEPGGRFLIYAKKMPLDRFRVLLETVRFGKTAGY